MTGVLGIPLPPPWFVGMLGLYCIGCIRGCADASLQFISFTFNIDKSSNHRVGSCLALSLVSPGGYKLDQFASPFDRRPRAARRLASGQGWQRLWALVVGFQAGVP
jgi:hypothetical protein